MTKYNKPPITEAVIEFQFVGEFSSADRAKIARKLKRNLPLEETVQEMLLITDATGVHQSTNPIGIRLSSRDRTETVSLSGSSQGPGETRPAAYSMSQLAPYCDWETFRSRFINGWAAVEKVIGHRKLLRIGVRFINRIDVPGVVRDFGQWVKIGAALPQELSAPLTFTILSVIPMGGSVQANVSGGPVPSLLPGHSAIALDIDVYTTGAIGDRLEERMELLDDFRQKKNYIFESCITDRARELFA